VEVLVEFEPGTPVEFFELYDLEQELSVLRGRKVDLNTPSCLSQYFRDHLLAEAEAHYAAP
jgi:uncharacterized protein